LTNIVSFPCEHFSVAQDTLSGSRFPGGTFGFDHLVDGAALARDSEVGHGANTRSAAPLPYHYRHDQLSRTSPARCCQGAVRRGFELEMWQAKHCCQLKRDLRPLSHLWPASHFSKSCKRFTGREPCAVFRPSILRACRN